MLYRIGVALLFVALLMADSENLTVPAVTLVIGIALMCIGSRKEVDHEGSEEHREQHVSPAARCKRDAMGKGRGVAYKKCAICAIFGYTNFHLIGTQAKAKDFINHSEGCGCIAAAST